MRRILTRKKLRVRSRRTIRKDHLKRRLRISPRRERRNRRKSRSSNPIGGTEEV